MLLSERVAVVTGAARGIGRAIAETFVREGAFVVLTDVDAGPLGEAVAACSAIREGAAQGVVANVAKREDTDRLMREAATRTGSIDILVNNAGVTRDKVVHQMTDEDWDLVIDVSLRGTFNCIRSVAPYMRDVAKREVEEHGEAQRVRKIVNFSSTAAIRGNPGQVNYAAAKLGNIGITRTMAQEWGRFRVCVNAVAPGFIETRLTAAKAKGEALGIPEEQRQAMLTRIPFARYGLPQDIANAVLFFASPLSDYVTGQDINVSGGMQIP